MGRLGLAFKMFFRVLRDGELAARAAALLNDKAPPESPEAAMPLKEQPRAQVRSDAITLLSVLQRESRLVDFLKESIAGYDDAQVGAAVRDIHRDASAAIERMLALRPVLEEEEGSQIELPPGFDPAQIRLVGNLGSIPPARGRLMHPGWRATRLDLPAYTGAKASADVVAPAEVEV